MSEKEDASKFTTALENTNVKGWKFIGPNPTNETEFNSGFILLFIEIVLLLDFP